MYDPKLNIMRHKADSGVVTKSRGLSTGETMIVKKKDFLYRQFTQGNKLKLIVPNCFRKRSDETGS